MMHSLFSNTELYPKDPIIGLTEAFRADPRTPRINLSVGAYCNDQGEVPLLAAVRAAERTRVAASPGRGYQPIEGSAAFNRAAQTLLFGSDFDAQAGERIATVQALGGTGAVRLAAEYLKTLFPDRPVYVSDPTWDNHRQIFSACGFTVRTYPYYNAATRNIDFAAMIACLKAAAPHSIIVLHVCCHNPTGLDLSPAQWQEVFAVMKQGELIPLLDMAYQGFGEGVAQDALPLQWCARAGLTFIVAASFSKSFSLYGERVGAVSVVAADAREAERVQSSLKRIIRCSYSNPPTHGGALILAILTNPGLRESWETELALMRANIANMRKALTQKLSARCSTHDFSHLLRQRGMFCYTGLNLAQVDRLRERHAIYAVKSGRICVAALNPQNIESVAQAIAEVLSDDQLLAPAQQQPPKRTRVIRQPATPAGAPGKTIQLVVS